MKTKLLLLPCLLLVFIGVVQTQTKDGKFVSMWMQLEYNFNLH